MKMLNKIRILVWLCISLSMLSITGCGNSERVHESWAAPAEGPHYEDNAILNNINSRLSANPELKNLVLNIDVKNGEVSIIGMVDNQSQVDQIIMQTWLVDGVKKVNNQIRPRNDQSTANQY